MTPSGFYGESHEVKEGRVGCFEDRRSCWKKSKDGKLGAENTALERVCGVITQSPFVPQHISNPARIGAGQFKKIYLHIIFKTV